MHVPAVHTPAISHELERRQDGLHPAASPGLDLFEFCHVGRPVKASRPWHGRTLTERVIYFMDQYKQSAA